MGNFRLTISDDSMEEKEGQKQQYKSDISLTFYKPLLGTCCAYIGASVQGKGA